MPLDFRYHLASLTAVFAALLIGILLGIAIKEGPRMSAQMESLRMEFRRSQSLYAIDNSADRFNERTRMLLMRERLQGRNIAIVYNALTYNEDNVAPVKQALEEAGARVSVVVALRPELLRYSPQQEARIYVQLRRTPESNSLTEMLHLLGLDIGRGWTRVATAMERERLISIDGDYATPVSTVVLLGGATTQQQFIAKALDVPFLRGCQRQGLRTAAAEPFTNEYSAISIYKKYDVPITVDNIDRFAGRISLVLALSENRRGHYGYKASADDVAPGYE